MKENTNIATPTQVLSSSHIPADNAANVKNKEARLHFPCKVYEMLEAAEDQGHEDIVSWNKEGTGFTVHNKELFTKKIIPLYFNQTKYKSFQRQLSLYGFQRITVGENKGLRYHEKLRRGMRNLTKEMKPIGYKPRASENKSKANKQSVQVLTQSPALNLNTTPSGVLPPPPRVVVDNIPAVVSSSSMCDDDQPKSIPYPSDHTPVEFTADGFPEMGCFEGKTFYLMDASRNLPSGILPLPTPETKRIPDTSPSLPVDGQMKRAWEIGFAVAMTMKPKTSVPMEVPVSCIDALDIHIMSVSV